MNCVETVIIQYSTILIISKQTALPKGPICRARTLNIAMAGHDRKDLMYDCPPEVWKRFRDDVFVVWIHNTAKLPSFLDYLNNTDETGKVKFTIQIAD